MEVTPVWANRVPCQGKVPKGALQPGSPSENGTKKLQMGHTTFPALCLFLLLFFGHCAPSKSSYFGENDWVAWNQDGSEFLLSSLDKEAIAINVYSPDCVPCWKEIPTLNFLYKEILENNPSRALYMVVDPYMVVPDLKPEANWKEAFSLALARMQKEVKDRKILLPILYMKPPFQISEGFLIAKTPETLLFETKPLRLYYNFVGAISEESDFAVIKRDPKVNFFRHQFGMAKR